MSDELPGLGHNKPPSIAKLISEEQTDFAAVATAYMEEAHAPHIGIVAALITEAEALPPQISSDEDKGRYTALIKRMRDESKALASIHSQEKTPYLRGGQGVDQFSFGLIDRLTRRDKRGRPGIADILSDRLTAYDTMLLRQEQERRRQEAAEALRIAQAKAAEAEAARKAEEARLAAERARKPETAVARSAVADLEAQRASDARIAAETATAQAEAAHVATLVRAADIMRRRGDDGTLSTMQEEGYAEIEDDVFLDRDILWPFLALEAKERALRAWAKSTGYRMQMPGARIGKRPRSVVR